MFVHVQHVWDCIVDLRTILLPRRLSIEEPIWPATLFSNALMTFISSSGRHKVMYDCANN